jgi:succinate-acetate transporter protein
MAWKKGNTFAFIAFLSYGSFWNTLIFLQLLPKIGISDAPEPAAMAWYCFIWGIFSVGMFVATLKAAPCVLCFVFFTAAILFFLLASHFWTGS